MSQTPFDITRISDDNWVSENTSHTVTVVSEVPSFMRRRRSTSPGLVGMREMLYVQLLDGTRVYVRQLENGHVDVHVTRREVYT